MTKPAKLSIGIGAAGALCAGLAALGAGPSRWLALWTAGACFAVAVAYATNRPGVFGKHDGRLAPLRALLLLPYLAAFRIGCALMRLFRRAPAWEEVAPGLYVGSRVRPGHLPPGLELIVDLTCEYAEPEPVRSHPGYRCLPVLDGAAPPDEGDFLHLLDEVRAASGGVLFHCESGKGRAPTAAALALIARGVASDPATALELVRKGRPSSAPTRVDLDFVERIARRLRREPRG
jgi:protein-tyrosine phosphatase